MNKKQRNRKLVAQNKRNRIINRRYTSTAKTLFKLFLAKTLSFKNAEAQQKLIIKQEIIIIINNLFSILDKATKKQILHKNTVARKKSRIFKLSSSV